MITLIRKHDKDPCLLTHCRITSLFNTDYKIGAKALASRLKGIYEQCAGDNQMGLIANRLIAENIMFILNLFKYT